MHPHPPKIFLSYRRDDRPRETRELHDLMTATFGPDQVFQDDVALRLGDRFAAVIEKTIAVSDVLVAVIGPGWLTCRRLDDPHDLLRREIEWALQYQVRVVSVLLDTTMPAPEELPASLAPLTAGHAVEFHDRRHFDADARYLVEELTRIHYGARPGIEPGRSVAGLELGAPESAIERELGSAERVPNDDGVVEYRYRGRGLQVYAWRGAVGGFFLTGIEEDGAAVCSARTNEGIGAGSSRWAVEDVYGVPDMRETNRGNNGFDADMYSKRGIVFCYSSFDRHDRKAPVAAIAVRPSTSIDDAR